MRPLIAAELQRAYAQIARDAKVPGVTARVVRYYVDEGLINPHHHSVYEALAIIWRLRKAGFSLAQIRVAMPRLIGAGADQLRALQADVRRHMEATIKFLERLHAQANELQDLDNEITLRLDEHRVKSALDPTMS